MRTCCALNELKQYMGLDPADSPHDAQYVAALETATDRAAHITRRTLVPYVATRWHDVLPTMPRLLFLADSILRLDGVTDAGGEVALELVTLEHPDLLRLDSEHAFLYDLTPRRAVAVRALWGWHPYPELRWVAMGTLSAPLDLTTPTLPVADSSAFAVGQLLQLGTELMRVLAVDGTAVTVVRGVSGSETAAHDAGTPVTRYNPPPMLADAVLGLAAYIVRRADNPTAPPPSDAFDTLHQLARLSPQL